jgi:uncharacterized membrane protein (UPF0136 family)
LASDRFQRQYRHEFGTDSFVGLYSAFVCRRIASSIFAAVLAFLNVKGYPFVWHASVLLFLLVFFGMRYAKSKKFMPAGLMILLTLAALISGMLLR